jgi:hypothetical protein
VAIAAVPAARIPALGGRGEAVAFVDRPICSHVFVASCASDQAADPTTEGEPRRLADGQLPLLRERQPSAGRQSRRSELADREESAGDRLPRRTRIRRNPAPGVPTSPLRHRLSEVVSSMASVSKARSRGPGDLLLEIVHAQVLGLERRATPAEVMLRRSARPVVLGSVPAAYCWGRCAPARVSHGWRCRLPAARRRCRA